jgi:hypothetical protein
MTQISNRPSADLTSPIQLPQYLTRGNRNFSSFRIAIFNHQAKDGSTSP